MTFLENIFARLEASADTRLLQESRDGQVSGVTGGELIDLVAKARAFLSTKGLKKGDRCALLAGNSIRWVAMDLAMMAEELIVVPLYVRQSPAELVHMMLDCSPELIVCADEGLRTAIRKQWAESPPVYVFDEAFAVSGHLSGKPRHVEGDAVAIIYTSGTSGDPKGVVLTASNLGHMLACTSARLDVLMEGAIGQDQVFHYLPFCFAGSWTLLLTCLLRGSLLTLNTDLNRLAEDMRHSKPDYFLNVPALLERMRKAVDEQLWKAGGLPQMLYSRAKGAWMRKQEGKTKFLDGTWLRLANAIVLPAIRKKMIGPDLRALICGSAPLNVETQLYFLMLGVPVLQGYGLTETTALCTLDDPKHVTPGRVGPAIPGVEMKVAENDEIVVRGPNIFAGYWHRPEETEKVLRDGWFHTGDQGDVDESGNWRIAGRIKNLIILGSGHNVAPEPIENAVLQALPGAQHVVLVGNGRGYLSAIVTGDVTQERVQRAIEEVNAGLPHYKQIRAFHVSEGSFTIEDGMLTANGKLKRDAIARRFEREIGEMYAVKQAG